MLPYIFLLFIALFFIIFDKEGKYSLIVLFSMFFFSAFRGENIGTDTIQYLNMDVYGYTINEWKDLINFKISRNYEILTNTILFVINKGLLPRRSIIIFFSFMISLFLWLISKRCKYNLGILCFFFLVISLYILSYNIARQICAVTILGYGITYIYDEKKSKSLLFFVFVLLAASIHISSISFGILYFFRWIRISYKVSIVILPLSFIFIFYSGYKFDHLILNLIPEGYTQSYGKLISTSEYTEVSVLGHIHKIIFLMLILYILPHIERKKIPLFTIAVIISYAFTGTNSVISRIALIFVFIIQLQYVEFFSLNKDTKNRIILYVICCLQSYVFIKSVISNPEIFPYVFCF